MNPTTGSTYTPTSGNTPAGVDVSSLLGALGGIGGPFPQNSPAGAAMQGYVGGTQQAAQQTANFPQFFQNTQQQTYNQAQLPQMTGQMGQLMQMFQADHALSGQYQNPSQVAGQPSPQAPDAVSAGAYGMPQLPMMTPTSVMQPFQGFTDPYMAGVAQTQQGSGVLGVINNLNSLLNYNATQANQKISTNANAYMANVQAEQQIANMLGGLVPTLMQYGQGTGGNPLAAIGGGSGIGSLIASGAVKPAQLKQQIIDAALSAPTTDSMNAYLKLADAVDKYAKPGEQLPQSASTQVQSQVSLYQAADDLANAFKDPATSKRLSGVMGNPVTSNLMNYIISSGQTELLPVIGLKPEDISYVSDMKQIMGTKDRTLVGGRLSGYLTKLFAPGAPSWTNTPGGNQALIKQIKTQIEQSAQETASNYGYDSWKTLPGFSDYLGQSTPNADQQNNDPLGIGI